MCTDTAAMKASHLRRELPKPRPPPRTTAWLASFRAATPSSRRSDSISACAASDAPLAAPVFISRNDGIFPIAELHEPLSLSLSLSGSLSARGSGSGQAVRDSAGFGFDFCGYVCTGCLISLAGLLGSTEQVANGLDNSGGKRRRTHERHVGDSCQCIIACMHNLVRTILTLGFSLQDAKKEKDN